MESVGQDFRYAVRVLLKRPGFTAVALFTLALGIGANTAIFSVVNAVLLRPLPFEDADRLVWLWGTQPQLDKAPIAPANFIDFSEQNAVFEQIFAYRGQSFNLTGQDEPERVRVAVVSASFFAALRVKPALGRPFYAEDEQPGDNQVVVLSRGLWQRRFGANQNIIGQSVLLNDRPYTVIGVAPDGFQFPSFAEMWTPLVFDARERKVRDTHSLSAIARLKPGVSLAQAQVQIDAVTARLQELYPQTNTGIGVKLVALQDLIVGNIRATLLVLLAAVGLVLLIACANVANLLLARAATRQKEIAIRVALGATRRRLTRQLLTESIILALAAGLIGLLLAYVGTRLLVAASPATIPRIKEVGVDASMLVFTLLVSVVTGILFGLAPALENSKADLNELLKEGGRDSSTGARGHRVRSLLVVSEIALALVLLTGAGLMIKSFLRLQRVDLGFDASNVLTAQIALPMAKYPEAQQRGAFFQKVIDRVRVLPGVDSAGAITSLPLSGANDSTSFVIEGRPSATAGAAPLTEYRSISPDYFRAMGMELVKGRYFTEADQANSLRVVIVNEVLAGRFFADEDPIGKRIGLSGPPDWREIVGVVRDVRDYGPDIEAKPECYLPYTQNDAGYLQYTSMTLVARAHQNPSSLASAVRYEVLAVDKGQPVYNIKTMEQVLSDSFSQRRLDTVLLGLLAAVAMVLATVGTYSAMAYSVTQRTHELGIRMALGAQRSDVIKLVARQGMVIALAGVTIGVGVSMALTRFLSSLLYQVSVIDPVVLVVVALVLGGAALAASCVPALRATRVDPLIALRRE